MKNLFVSTLVVFLVIFSSCSSDDDTSDPVVVSDPIIGTWKITKSTINGIDQSLNACALNSTWAFLEDGTLVMTIFESNGVCVADRVNTRWKKLSDSMYTTNAITDGIMEDDVFLNYSVSFMDTKAVFTGNNFDIMSVDEYVKQ
ncbi:lipocalin family protein [uncultured Aquimarina sp.]|uniref:lipocalin family protein n=1 Tax=uncultured Aquimarina sp. TaxID=575652 RepID=UPI00262C3A8B|nr:lipocalin family protein [uncultured Aquimarina sp.]